MSTDPLIESIRLVRTAIATALTARSGGRVVYWSQASERAAYPFVVFQSQDNGGVIDRVVGGLRWRGLITVKAFAQMNGSGNAQAAAESLMEAIAPGMASLTSPSGYTISARHERPVVIPPLDGVWQAAHLWRVQLERI